MTWPLVTWPLVSQNFCLPQRSYWDGTPKFARVGIPKVYIVISCGVLTGLQSDGLCDLSNPSPGHSDFGSHKAV